MENMESTQLGPNFTPNRPETWADNAAGRVDSKLELRKLKSLSVVVPCHNEGKNVRLLYERLHRVFSEKSIPFEIIFVDDSTDDTPLYIVQLHQVDERVKMIRLTRSFGQSLAIFAGLEAAKGDVAIVMDSDLEDPPESIPLFLDPWARGADVVVAKRQRVATSPSYRAFSYLYYNLSHLISQVEIPQNVGEFRLLDRKVIDLLKKFPERARFFRGLTLWPGFKTEVIEIQREARIHGVTQYNFWRATSVAIDGLVSFSFVPLRLIAVTGIGLSVLAGLVTVFYVVRRLIDPNVFSAGWASIFILLLFASGLNLLFLGIVAEYVGRIFQQVQGRPLYVVDYKIGL
jgi:glycosyltransferase involved in cell wall biosynthesis